MKIENFYIDEMPKSVSKEMIVKNHYSKKFSKCTVALGLFNKKDSLFFEGDSDELIGTMTYGDPVGSNVCSSISPVISQGEVFELTRLWTRDDTPKNTESWFIGQSFYYLRKNYPHIKVLISYADPAAGHKGTIYQATNWLYCPTGQIAGDYTVSFDGENFVHVRTLENTYGGLGLENMKKKLPKPFWIQKNSTKVRYIYILATGKEKKSILKTLKYKPNEYKKQLDKSDKSILKIE